MSHIPITHHCDTTNLVIWQTFILCALYALLLVLECLRFSMWLAIAIHSDIARKASTWPPTTNVVKPDDVSTEAGPAASPASTTTLPTDDATLNSSSDNTYSSDTNSTSSTSSTSSEQTSPSESPPCDSCSNRIVACSTSHTPNLCLSEVLVPPSSLLISSNPMNPMISPLLRARDYMYLMGPVNGQELTKRSMKQYQLLEVAIRHFCELFDRAVHDLEVATATIEWITPIPNGCCKVYDRNVRKELTHFLEGRSEVFLEMKRTLDDMDTLYKWLFEMHLSMWRLQKLKAIAFCRKQLRERYERRLEPVVERIEMRVGAVVVGEGKEE